MLILICDDDQDHRELRAALLLQRGHNVDAVGSPIDAFDQLAAKEYDLVISDMMMPEISGCDLLRQARERGHLMPFALLSGHVTVVENPQHYRSCGFATVINKNAGFDHFLREVERVGAQATERLEDV